MCIDPKLEYCRNTGCKDYRKCLEINRKYRYEAHQINLLVPKTICGALRNMRVGENSPLRRDKNILW